MKKSIFVFGAGKNGNNIKKIYESFFDERISFFVDNDIQKQGCKFYGIEIISFIKMLQICESSDEVVVLIAIGHPEAVIEQMRSYVVPHKKVYVLSNKYKKSSNQRDIDFCDAMNEIDCSLHRLDYLETHVANHCNLKCKGCGHLSNLIPVSYPDYQQFLKDLKRMKQFFWGIATFRLLGGEPLLNPELPKYIEAVYNEFPDSDIRVVTNGLLIPTVDDSLFEVMERCCAGFDISLYMPTKNIRSKIELICIEKNVEYTFSNLVEKFYTREKDTAYKDPYVAYSSCDSKTCHFMMNGQLSLCPAPILRKMFSDYTNKKYIDEDIIDIHNPDLNGEKIYDLMNCPNHQCAYCSDRLVWFNWERDV